MTTEKRTMTIEERIALLERYLPARYDDYPGDEDERGIYGAWEVGKAGAWIEVAGCRSAAEARAMGASTCFRLADRYGSFVRWLLDGAPVRRWHTDRWEYDNSLLDALGLERRGND